MDERLRELAESRYGQTEFLSTLFELALEEQWFDLQHLIQHDMAKAILADYSYELGKGYLNQEVFYSNWEPVIEIGWRIFCNHTGLTMDKVNSHLTELREAIQFVTARNSGLRKRFRQEICHRYWLDRAAQKRTTKRQDYPQQSSNRLDRMGSK
jgi:hypothetical protein